MGVNKSHNKRLHRKNFRFHLFAKIRKKPPSKIWLGEPGVRNPINLRVYFMSEQVLPDNLPVPKDDGACDHLEGMLLPSPSLTFESTNGPVRSHNHLKKQWLISPRALQQML
jgi:hypothetical protein